MRLALLRQDGDRPLDTARAGGKNTALATGEAASSPACRRTDDESAEAIPALPVDELGPVGGARRPSAHPARRDAQPAEARQLGLVAPSPADGTDGEPGHGDRTYFDGRARRVKVEQGSVPQGAGGNEPSTPIRYAAQGRLGAPDLV